MSGSARGAALALLLALAPLAALEVTLDNGCSLELDHRLDGVNVDIWIDWDGDRSLLSLSSYRTPDSSARLTIDVGDAGAYRRAEHERSLRHLPIEEDPFLPCHAALDNVPLRAGIVETVSQDGTEGRRAYAVYEMDGRLVSLLLDYEDGAPAACDLAPVVELLGRVRWRAPDADARYDLSIDDQLWFDAERLPSEVTALIFAHGSGLEFFGSRTDEVGELTSGTVVVQRTDPSRYRNNDRLVYLEHEAWALADPAALPLGAPAASGIVEYQWVSNRHVVRRAYLVYELADGPLSILIGLDDDEEASAGSMRIGLELVGAFRWAATAAAEEGAPARP